MSKRRKKKCEKASYPTREAANKTIAFLRNNRGASHIEAYRCPDCRNSDNKKLWHIGHIISANNRNHGWRVNKGGGR